MGKLLAIAYKKASREPMEEVSNTNISNEMGLENDYKGSKSAKRQITILLREDWESACKHLNKTIDWKVRRANLYMDGISIKQSKGKIIKIGDEIILEVMGETKPCYRMDEQIQGLTLALMKDWKGGVCCKVIQGGNLKVGDKIEID